MINNRKNQVTIVVDKKQGPLGQLLFDLITEKNYIVNMLTPKQKEDNPKLSSENKVIYLSGSKLYKNVRKYTEPINEHYGMEYGWRGNSCFIGVNSKKFKLDDKEEIVKLFPKSIQSRVEKQEHVKEQEESIEDNDENENIMTYIKNISDDVFLKPKKKFSLNRLNLPGTPQHTYKIIKKIKSKTDLKKEMELAIIYNFVNHGLDEFMERE